MKRRDLLKGGMAMSAFVAATPLLAHDEIIPDYQLPEEFMPREVRLETVFEPNEIHVDPGQFALYWTLPKKKASDTQWVLVDLGSMRRVNFLSERKESGPIGGPLLT